MSEPKIPRPKGESSTLEAALKYMRRGWSVVPIGEKTKSPLVKWEKYQTQRATEQKIKEWWIQNPSANVGIITGKISNLIVVDVDTEAGALSLKPYLNNIVTLTASTPRGGKHLYFRHSGQIISNIVGLFEGVDVRGDGGLVVAPPSKKGLYSWDSGATKAIDVPIQLLELLQRPPVASGGIKEWTSEILKGHRDDELTRRAGKLLRAGLPAGECLTILQTINQAHCKPPLRNVQVQKIVASIAGREVRKLREKQAGPDEKKEFRITPTKEVFMKYERDETQWIIDGWLPEASCGLVVAPPGSYKTWILLNLAFAIGTGRPFLGQCPITKKGSVLIIQQEDPFPMLLGRTAKMFNAEAPKEEDGIHSLDCRFTEEMLDMPIHWHEDRELNLEDEKCMDRFEAKVAELKPALVEIDPLYSAVTSKDYMASGAQSMLRLKKLRDRYGCTFIIAHHTTVAGGKSEDRASIWGSQFLNAWLEFGWQIRETNDENTVKMIRHFKGSEDPKRLHLKFNITDWTFNVEIDEKFSETIRERIEEVILNGGDVGSVRDIAKLVGCSIATVSRTIKKMDVKKDDQE